MSLDLDAIRDAHLVDGREATHWDDCHLFHTRCAIAALLAEVERLRAAIEKHRHDWPSRIGDPTPHDERLHAVLDQENDT